MSRMRELIWLVGSGLVLSLPLAGCGNVKNTGTDGGAGGDAAVGDASGVDGGSDAALAMCGNGLREPGEVCYGQAIILNSNDVTYDAHLADMDGDGDLDVVYLIGDQYKFHPQNAGQFAATGLDGPTTFSRYAVARDLGGTARAELVDVGDQAISVWGFGSNGFVALGSAAAPTGSGTAKGMGLGHITGGAAPNVVALYGNSVVLGTFDASLRLTATVVANPNSPRDVTVGRLDGDALGDIVVAGGAGVLLYRGMNGGVAQTTVTGQTASTDAVVVGDVDNDGIADLAFAVAGTAGQLGVMLGVGGAAFVAPQTRSSANLAPVLEAADVDGDGRADVVGARTQSGANAVLVALGQADGTLAEPVALPIATQANYLRAEADFNGDGAPDLVATDTNAQTIVILPSNP